MGFIYYYGARYYNPVIGRFITADGVVPDPTNSQSFNRYSYVFNNPINFVDPFGNQPVINLEPIVIRSGGLNRGISSNSIHPGVLQWQLLHSVVQGVIGSPQGINNVQTTADLAGILDPTPTIDLTNAAFYARRGQYGNAIASGISAIPYVGDLIGKGGKYAFMGIAATTKRITVIGSRSDTLKYLGKKLYNVLNIENWTPAKNIKWLDAAIKRGDDIMMATDPLKHQELMQQLDKASAFTDLELPHLLEKGFIQKGKRMIQ